MDGTGIVAGIAAGISAVTVDGRTLAIAIIGGDLKIPPSGGLFAVYSNSRGTSPKGQGPGDFSKPVEISRRLWGIKESPKFSIGHDTAWVLTESAVPAATSLE
jgi:hypothetical protein